MDPRLYSPFLDSAKNILKQMANIEIKERGNFYCEEDDVKSLGVSCIVSFSGKINGRLLLDLKPSLAVQVAKNLTGIDYPSPKDFMVLASISELNNTIAGDGITVLNNQHSLSLRLAPPIVFTGTDSLICTPKFPQVSLDFTTDFGDMKLNIAFDEEDI